MSSLSLASDAIMDNVTIILTRQEAEALYRSSEDWRGVTASLSPEVRERYLRTAYGAALVKLSDALNAR